MEKSDKPWWYTQDEESLWGNVPTREAAIAAGTTEYGGEPFLICQGGHFRNRFDIFDRDWLSDRFDNANEDYAGEEYPSDDWTDEHVAELERELAATMQAWGERHGYHKAYGIDAGPTERIVPGDAA